MTSADQQLLRHLAVALLIKLLLLGALWWAFARHAGVVVDARGVSARVATPLPARGGTQ